MTKPTLIKAIKTHSKTIAKERDELRMLIGEAEDIVASCDEALDGLERAVEALSQYL